LDTTCGMTEVTNWYTYPGAISWDVKHEGATKVLSLTRDGAVRMQMHLSAGAARLLAYDLLWRNE
jgi:hypothetical protein